HLRVNHILPATDPIAAIESDVKSEPAEFRLIRLDRHVSRNRRSRCGRTERASDEEAFQSCRRSFHVSSPWPVAQNRLLARRYERHADATRGLSLWFVMLFAPAEPAIGSSPDASLLDCGHAAHWSHRKSAATKRLTSHKFGASGPAFNVECREWLLVSRRLPSAVAGARHSFVAAGRRMPLTGTRHRQDVALLALRKRDPT